MDPIDELKAAIAAQHLPYTRRSLVRGEFLKQGGTIDTQLYFVEQGSLRVFYETEEETHCVYFGYAGSLLTAIDSFLSEAPSDYCIQAIKACELQVIEKSALMAYVAASAENFGWWNRILAELILRQRERERDLFASSPQQRYQRLLERQPKLFQEIPHKYIASYLRMTPETFSRLQKS